MRVDENKLISVIEHLNKDAMQKITDKRQTIYDLYGKLELLRGIQYQPIAHEITFSFLLAEYVWKLKPVILENDVDFIFLQARRLFEVLITLKYIIKNNNFPDVMEYCVFDRYKYLESCKVRAMADAKLFPELGNFDDYFVDIELQKKEWLQKTGSAGKKMSNIRVMAQDVACLEEYDYFYKLTSKMLHFCPFSLNGDADYNAPLHKVVFLQRIAKYLEEIDKGLSDIYQNRVLSFIEKRNT